MTVPIRPHLCPARLIIERTRNATVVLPFVPVTARLVSFAAGLPFAACARIAGTSAVSSTTTYSYCVLRVLFADDMSRAVGDGLRDKIVAVAGCALDGYENIAFPDGARIYTNTGRFAGRNQF